MSHLLSDFDNLLTEWLQANNYPKFRLGQIRQWVFEKKATSFDQMTNLPVKMRTHLANDFSLWSSKVIKSHKTDDSTEKLLIELHDGHRIECVMIPEGKRRTICISTQVGCAMGCVFCASGLEGVIRDLTPGEIIEQMLLLNQVLDEEERISNIVVMGMGEPLANLNGLLPALEYASRSDGLGIGARKITISTVGLPKAMEELVALKTQYHLAVSLHAAEEKLREYLVPVSKNIPLDDIMEQADRFFEATGRRVTYEYVLLSGVNDQPEHANQIVRLLKNRNALVNVIPFNPVEGLEYETPSKLSVDKFLKVLEDGRITTRIRKRKGDKISAACGQLRRSQSKNVVSIDPSS